MKPGDIQDIIKFVKDYMNDNNSQMKMSIPSDKQIDLLKIIKKELNANEYGRNSIIYDNIIIYIYHKDYAWHIKIKNIDLMEPIGPI